MDFLEEIKKILAEKVNKRIPLTMKTKLKDLGLDSLDLVEIILEAEDRFGITFDNYEIIDYETIGDVVKAAERKSGY